MKKHAKGVRRQIIIASSTHELMNNSTEEKDIIAASSGEANHGQFLPSIDPDFEIDDSALIDYTVDILHIAWVS